MRTLPATLESNARRSDAVFLVEVYPKGADTWSVMRWADRAVSVDGNAYEAGVLREIPQIRTGVRIRTTGGAATRTPITLRLTNKNKLHELLQTREIEGRDIRVSYAMMPLNRLKNSSFELRTGDDFDDWTETAGHASNTIERTATAYEGSDAVHFDCAGSPGPKIVSTSFKIRRGEPITVSGYARAAIASSEIAVNIKVGALYWDATTSKFKGAGFNDFTFAPGTGAYERFEVTAYDPNYIFSSDELDCEITFQVKNTGDGIYLDAVMAEARWEAGIYHRHKDEMVEADLFPVYYGEVKVPKWDRNAIELKTKSIMNRRHRDIPIDTITTEHDADWNIPPKNVGKPFPMTYGDFGSYPDQDSELFPNEILAVGLLVNLKEESGNPILVAYDSPRSGIDHTGQGLTYHQDKETGRYFIELFDDQSTPTFVAKEWDLATGNSKTIKARSGAGYLPVGRMAVSAFLKAIHWSDNDASGGKTWNNPDNGVDLDGSSYMDDDYTSESGSSGLTVETDTVGVGDGQIIGVYALTKHAMVLSSGVPNLNIRAIGEGYSYQRLIAQATDGNNIPWMGGTDQQTEKPFEKNSVSKHVGFWLGAGRDTYFIVEGSLTGTGTIKVYGVGVRVDFSLDLMSVNFANPRYGRYRAGAWDGRYSSRALIDTPSELIEGILRQELGVSGSSNINLAAFDAAYSAQSTWLMRGQLLKRRSSELVFDDICACSGLLYQSDAEGKESVKVLGYGSPVRVLSEADFADDPTFTYTPREEVINSYVFHYAYSPHQDEYTRSLYCNKDSQDLGASSYATKCANSYAAMGNIENFAEFEFPWIHDDATAILAAKWIIDWNYQRRRIGEGTVFLDQLGLELGDLVSFDLPNTLLEDATDPTRPVFVITDSAIDKKSKIKMEFQEVPSP